MYLMWSIVRGFLLIKIDQELDFVRFYTGRVSATSLNYRTDITSTVPTYSGGGKCGVRRWEPTYITDRRHGGF
jgi:hypothetical protein